MLAAIMAAGSGFAHAQEAASTSEGGYEVTRSQSVTKAPHGWIGRKTTDRETRVGNKPETDGNSANLAMTIGGWVKKCPTAAGKVAGNYEYSLTSEAVNTDEGETQRTNHAKRVTATFEGHVKDDGMLDTVDMDAVYTSEHNGVRAAPIRDRRSFRPGQMGEPDMEAIKKAVAVTGDLAIAAVMWQASQDYAHGPLEWGKLNACVELVFDPPSETRSLGSSESVPVRVELRTKEDPKMPVAGARLQGGVLQGAGSLAPRQAESEADAPLTFTYTASAKPKKGHGFESFGPSRAGAASAKWLIAERSGFEGTFTQTETSSVSATDVAANNSMIAAARGYAAMTGLQKITGRLVWSPEADSSRPRTFEDVESKFYVPTEGQITVAIESEGKSLAGSCVIEGSKSFAIRSLPPAAMKYLVLEVAEDGRYRMMLGMVSYFLQFDATQKCTVQAAPGFPIAMPGGGSEAVTINDAAIVIGRQEGRLVEDRIVGKTLRPIVEGVHSYVGEWQFQKSPQAGQ